MKLRTITLGLSALALIAACLTAGALPKPESPAEACFAKIKSLAGDWYMKDDKGKEVLALRYRVTSGGSTVEESIFSGQPHEMISMYHMEGGSLAMTHYCAVGNQPHMKAAASSTPTKIVFDCASVGNSKSHNDMHMHHAVIAPKDSKHFLTEWSSLSGSKPGMSAKFDVYRKDTK